MKTSTRLFENILILALGILFVYQQSSPNVLTAFVWCLSIVFIIPALANLIALFVRRHRELKLAQAQERAPQGKGALTIGVVSSVGTLLLGAVLLCFPQYFVGALRYVIGVALIIGGIYQFYVIGSGYKPISFPGWFYLPPALILAAGAVMLFVAMADNVMILVAGIAMIVFALTSFLEIVAVRSFHRSAARQQSLTTNQQSTTE